MFVGLSLRNLQKHYNIFEIHAPWLSLKFQTNCARIALGFDPMFKVNYNYFADLISLQNIFVTLMQQMKTLYRTQTTICFLILNYIIRTM